MGALPRPRPRPAASTTPKRSPPPPPRPSQPERTRPAKRRSRRRSVPPSSARLAPCPIPRVQPAGSEPICGRRTIPTKYPEGPLMAKSRPKRRSRHRSALPRIADIRGAMSAFAAITSASPPGADVLGGVAECRLMTLSGHSFDYRRRSLAINAASVRLDTSRALKTAEM